MDACQTNSYRFGNVQQRLQQLQQCFALTLCVLQEFVTLISGTRGHRSSQQGSGHAEMDSAIFQGNVLNGVVTQYNVVECMVVETCLD